MLRYIERSNFVPQDFWYLHNEIVDPESNDKTVLNWERGRLFDEERTKQIYEDIKDHPLKVVSTEKKEKQKYKPRPLNTIEF